MKQNAVCQIFVISGSVLAILLFARYFQEYQRLKQDHDLFI